MSPPRRLSPALRAVVDGTHASPHAVLGRHRGVVRIWQPGAVAVEILDEAGGEPAEKPVEATCIHPSGLFEAKLAGKGPYRYVATRPDGSTTGPVDDPYRFWPTVGDVDLHLIGEGSHRRLWEVLGARPMVHDGVKGTAFSVWAPAARGVRVVGDWNGWDGRAHPMRSMGVSGVWELFLPAVGAGARYKFEILGADGHVRHKADPVARWSEEPPATASVVFESKHRWHDEGWVTGRAQRDMRESQRLSIYEVHLGSWSRSPDDPDRWLGWDQLGPQLADYVSDLGFSHVELMPIMEHPFGGSWGYQVSGYYAPTARLGDPDGFRRFVDLLHQRGIGVLIDWVPAHFPRDDFALARFDGTSLYEHADPRIGEHPDWGTLVFDYGRIEVRNFLIANALYWIDEFHVDGLRVDAVASMLYLDYSREAGEWVPNVHGGRENLEAIAFIHEMNAVVHGVHPGVLTIAEESTAFPAVSHPVDQGGLGFTHKWNMGWMHDTLDYVSREAVHRKWHHHELTFGLVYAWTERFVLPLSHDEVVHLKRPLLEKMPGDEWQRYSTLRALLAWMWSHPGGQLLFMGGELAQRREWSHDTSLDWHLLSDPRHAGVRDVVRELNRLEGELPALWSLDHDPSGFRWLDANDADHSCYSFARRGAGDAAPVVVAANFTPVSRHGYRIGVPTGTRWREALNTDDGRWGGSGATNDGDLVADDATAWQNEPASLRVTLPPLGVVWLTPANVG
ncbi:MAG: 1,4-alpha-glucan branching protein GlgB [Acidimicrobiales bacterium]